MMRRLLLTLNLLACLAVPALTYVPAAAQATDPVCQHTNQAEQPGICKPGSSSTQDPLVGRDGILTKAVFILGVVVGVCAIIVIVISGLRFIISAGDSNSVSAARRSLIFAVVALVVAATAQLIVAFVLNNL